MDRYIILVILNLPILIIGIISALAAYKMQKIARGRFLLRLGFWLVAVALVVGALPAYNIISGRQPFDASDVSLLNIFLITVVFYLVLIANSQRQRIDQIEKRQREFHQEIAIKLSERKTQQR